MRARALALVALLLATGCLTAKSLTEPAWHHPRPGLALAWAGGGELQGARLLGPGGQVVVEALAGPAGHLSIADEPAIHGTVEVVLEGDPVAGEAAALIVQVDGQRWRFQLAGTLQPAYRLGQQATGGHVLTESPAGPPPASLLLGAGPVVLEEDGTLSPRFAPRARLSVEGAEAGSQAWLTVDGGPRLTLPAAGQGPGTRVFQAELSPWTLGQAHGDEARLTATVQRPIVPGLSHRHDVAHLQVRLDAEGPEPPAAGLEGRWITWEPPEANATVAVVATGPSPRPLELPVIDQAANLSSLAPGAWNLTLQATDAVGNPGPRSAPLAYTVEAPEPPLAPPPPTRLGLTAGQLLEGPVELAWEPDPSIARIVVEAQRLPEDTWQLVAEGQAPPIRWETRLWPDGDYRVRVAAHGPAGATSQLVEPVTVDNLGPVPEQALPPEAPRPSAAPPASLPPADPGHPLPAALAVLLSVGALGALAVAGLVGKGTGK